jgi:hypothetical protein
VVTEVYYKYQEGIMADKKTTQLQIREDRPTAISSAAFGANLNTFGFNIDLIACKNTKLAVTLINNYGDAHSIKATDPDAPSEDYELFNEALKKLDSSEE